MPYVTTFMDTSDDYLSAWNKFDHEPVGVPGVALDEEQTVGLYGLGESHRDFLMSLTPAERAELQEELDRDPGFRSVIQRALRSGNPRRYLVVTAGRAAVNELDPKSFPETAGTWKALRAKIRAAVRVIPGVIRESLDKLTFQERLKFLEAYLEGKTLRVSLGFAGGNGLGFWADIAGSVANTAASIYGSKLAADTQKDIAKIQAAAAARQADTQLQIAKAQQLIAASKAQQAQYQAKTAEVAGIVTQKVAGIPMWGWVLGLGALGVTLYFVLR